MSLFVDTSVWSLAFRRDRPAKIPEVAALMQELEGGNLVTTTGLVYQELLQGFHGPSDQQAIVERFSALPFLMPDPDWSERPRAARDLHQAVREPARSTSSTGAVLFLEKLSPALERIDADLTVRRA